MFIYCVLYILTASELKESVVDNVSHILFQPFLLMKGSSTSARVQMDLLEQLTSGSTTSVEGKSVYAEEERFSISTLLYLSKLTSFITYQATKVMALQANEQYANSSLIWLEIAKMTSLSH